MCAAVVVLAACGAGRAPEGLGGEPGLVDGARVDGGGVGDPVGQAIATSQRLFGDGEAGRVVLATADRFPDALGGAALAGDDGPILLTAGLGALDDRVEAEIGRVTGGDALVLVLGGDAAVSAQAAEQAIAAGGGRPCAAPFLEGCRYAGTGREHTAALVAETVIAEHPGDTVLVARGDVFADAITGGAFSAAAGVPVLFTPPDAVNESTAAFIEAQNITEVVALGGEAAINQATLEALPADSRERVEGAERTATSAAIARSLWGASDLGRGGALLVNVRHEQGWQTALTATVASALHGAPQIGVESPPATLGPEVSAYLGGIRGPIEAYGGAELVSDEQLAAALAARGTGPHTAFPEPGASFQWQLSDYPIDLSIEADVWDLDYELTPADVVRTLNDRGSPVICYLSAGSWEDFRPDAGDFPEEALGEELGGFPDERWLDIRATEVLLPLIAARVDICAEKGFDAIEFDNVDGYTNDTGFPLTAADQLTHNRALADLAHDRGMLAVLKNDLAQTAELLDDFEILLLEQCVEFDECADAAPYLDAGRLVFDVEYDVEADEACPAEELGMTVILKNLDLDAPVQQC